MPRKKPEPKRARIPLQNKQIAQTDSQLQNKCVVADVSCKKTQKSIQKLPSWETNKYVFRPKTSFKNVFATLKPTQHASNGPEWARELKKG